MRYIHCEKTEEEKKQTRKTIGRTVGMLFLGFMVFVSIIVSWFFGVFLFFAILVLWAYMINKEQKKN